MVEVNTIVHCSLANLHPVFLNDPNGFEKSYRSQEVDF